MRRKDYAPNRCSTIFLWLFRGHVGCLKFLIPRPWHVVARTYIHIMYVYLFIELPCSAMLVMSRFIVLAIVSSGWYNYNAYITLYYNCSRKNKDEE